MLILTVMIKRTRCDIFIVYLGLVCPANINCIFVQGLISIIKSIRRVKRLLKFKNTSNRTPVLRYTFWCQQYIMLLTYLHNFVPAVHKLSTIWVKLHTYKIIYIIKITETPATQAWQVILVLPKYMLKDHLSKSKCCLQW